MSSPSEQSPIAFSKLAERLIGEFRGIGNDQPGRQVKRPTKSIADVMEGVTSQFGIGQASREQSLRNRWPDLVTPTLATYSHVVRINAAGWLVIVVTNPVAKQELSNNRHLFLRQIQAVPGCASIKGLSLRAG